MKKLIDLTDYPNFIKWTQENCRDNCNTWQDALIYAGYTSCTWPYDENNDSSHNVSMSSKEYEHFLLRFY